MTNKDLEIVKLIADESLRLLLATNSKKTLEIQIIGQYLTAFIENIATKVLKSQDSSLLTEEAKYNEVSKTYVRLKNEVQDSIAEGFGKSMTNLTGLQVTYYCTMNLIPGSQSKNKLPC